MASSALLNQTQRDELERLARIGVTQAQIADYFGISERTLRNRFQQDPAIAAAYKRGRADGVAKVGATLYQQAMGGNLTACIFYLKTQGRWTETQKHEISGPEGQPVPLGSLTEAERLQAIERLLQARRNGTHADAD